MNGKNEKIAISDQLQTKLDEIGKTVEVGSVTILGITGFSDYREMCVSLFHVMALLEVMMDSYLATDSQVMKTIFKQTYFADFKDRFESYISTVKLIRS